MKGNRTWPLRRLKYVVHRSTQKAAVEPGSHYIGLENIEPWTGRYLPSETQIEGESVQFRSGDVLFGKLRPYLAKVYVAKDGGTCTSEMLVLRPGPEISQRFLFYRLVSGDFIDLVNSTTFGSKMPMADWEQIGNIPIAVPSAEEQANIVSFIDCKTLEIDQLLEKKQRLIEMLDEKRHALVARAVTQGLDPSVPMKDSGVPWLGCIPANWRVSRLKFAVANIEQGWSPQCDSRSAEFEEWGVLKVGCVNGGTFDESENKTLPSDLEADVRLEIRPGDVLISRANTRELVGSTALVESVRPRLLLCDKLYRVKVGKSMTPQFVALLLQCNHVRYQMEREANGTSGSMQNIGQDTIRNLRFALPELLEQSAITEWATHQSVKFHQETSALRRTIDCLREYRSALITAAVTGQLDLREHERKMEALT